MNKIIIYTLCASLCASPMTFADSSNRVESLSGSAINEAVVELTQVKKDLRNVKMQIQSMKYQINEITLDGGDATSYFVNSLALFSSAWTLKSIIESKSKNKSHFFDFIAAITSAVSNAFAANINHNRLNESKFVLDAAQKILTSMNLVNAQVLNNQTINPQVKSNINTQIRNLSKVIDQKQNNQQLTNIAFWGQVTASAGLVLQIVAATKIEHTSTMAIKATDRIAAITFLTGIMANALSIYTDSSRLKLDTLQSGLDTMEQSIDLDLQLLN